MKPPPTMPRHRIPAASRSTSRPPNNETQGAQDHGHTTDQLHPAGEDGRQDARRDGALQREGTPRPESSAVRAHVPACFWFFADSWNNIYRNGVLDHAVKELCRL